jgi:hypothetical protein
MFWNGSVQLALAELLELPEPEVLEAVCFLVMAMKHGTEAVDDWILENAWPPVMS